MARKPEEESVLSSVSVTVTVDGEDETDPTKAKPGSLVNELNS
jgi:hypothetical protein